MVQPRSPAGGLRIGRVSLRIGLSSIFVLVVVVTAVCLGTATFLSVRQMIRQDIRERIHDAVGTAALSIDPAVHARLQGREDQSLPEYEAIRARLQAIRRAGTGFRFVYTVRPGVSARPVFVVDAEEDAAQASRIGDPVDAPTPTMLSAFESPPTIRVERELSSDNWGTFLSGYAPIVDRDGRIEAIVGMDISADNILLYERRLLGTVALITIGVCAVVASAAFVMSRYVSRPLVAIAAEMQRIRHFDLAGSALPDSRVKEVAEMSEALANMKGGLRSFRKYVPAEVVRDLLALGREAELGAERRTLSIMFSDVRDFTTLSEQLDPEDLAARLAEYLGGMTRIVLGNGGTVDKYVGDAIVAFWNAPRDVSDHAERAVRTALECQAFSEELADRWKRTGIRAFETRVGIDTGDVVVGNFGYEDRMDYTAIGHHVNIASRLESLNKVYGSRILCGPETWNLVRDRFSGRFIDRVAVKGSKAVISIYEPLAPAREGLVGIFDRATELYGARRFEEAAAAFEACLATFPDDGPSAALRARSRQYAAEPPPVNWNGAFLATDK
jgi:adenylate cyclase